MSCFNKKINTLLFMLALFSLPAQELSIDVKHKIDSLEKNLLKAKEDTNKVILFNALSTAFLETGSYDHTIELANKSVALSAKLKYKQGLSEAYSNLGVVFDYRSDYIKSIEYHNKSLALKTQLGDGKGIAIAYSNLAIVYEYLGKFPEALKYQYNALQIHEKRGDQYGVGVIYINMGSIYAQQVKYKDATGCYEKALAIFKKMKSRDGIAYAEMGLGMIDLYIQKYIESEEHVSAAKIIFEEIGDKQNIAIALVNLGQIYVSRKDFKKALESYDLARKLNFEMGDKRNISYSYLGLGTVNIALKKYTPAKIFLDSAIFLANSIGCIECLKDDYASYMQLDSSSSDYKNGYTHVKKYMLIKDSLISQENNKKSNQAKLQYDFDKKTIADSLKNSENKKQEEFRHQQEIKVQKTYSYGAIFGFILMLIIAGTSYRAYKQKQKANKIIEQQKEMVEEKQKEIIDSINYAKRIQYTLLANEQLMTENLTEHFVYFKPKAVVSGDFYWAIKKDNLFYLAVCDSTGHGVPGAFMSLLNINFLNEAVNEKNIKAPNEILNHVRGRLIENMDGGRDGMDAVIICIDRTKKQITYAAANNEPLLIKNNILSELQKDKMPVGKGENENSFTLFTLTIEKNDIVYLYTDGYADQFGGPKGKKFKYKELNHLLLSNSLIPFSEQSKLLDEKFKEWKGQMEQVDDVCIIGIKI